MSPRKVILTGERGVGKSTICCRTIALAQAGRRTCGGLLTPRRAGDVLDVVDVSSGHTRQLTVDGAPGDTPAVIQGRFRFDPQTLAWGNQVLEGATPCHLLVVDELGPLELERGAGWQRAFDVLDGDPFALGLVVVRPELVFQAQARLGTVTVLIATLPTRDDLPALLLERLEREIARWPAGENRLGRLQAGQPILECPEG